MEKTTEKNAWIFWLPAATFIFFQFILQVFPSVTLDELGGAFHANLIQIGNMSSLFYYAFAISLIPIGITMDRFSISKILTYSIWTCSLGSLIFAISHSLFEASIGRIMMGIGGSAAFVGTMRIVAMCFPSKSIGLASGFTIASAMLGAILGQTFVSYLVKYFGWRETMGIIVAFGILLGLIILFVAKKLPEHIKNSSSNNIKTDLFTIIGCASTWKPALYASLIYIPLPVFAGLWGIPFFFNVYHFSHEFSALACAFVWLGMGFGSPTLGWLSDQFYKRRDLMLLSSLLVTAISIIILTRVVTNQALILFFMFAQGFFCGAYSLAFSTLRSVTPVNISGLAVAFVMTVVMIVIAVATQLIGFILYIIKMHPIFNIGITNNQYQIATLIMPILVFVAYFVAKLLPKHAG